MKIKYLVLLSLITIVSIEGVAQSILSTEDAIKIGLQNNFNIRIARLSAEAAHNNSRLGHAGFMPTLNATGSFSRTTSDQTSSSTSPVASIGNTDTDVLAGQVALNWTIFDGFRMFTSNRQLAALANAGEATARSQIEAAVVAILSAYFNAVQQKQLLAVQQTTLDISRERLEKVKVRREVGGVSSTDYLNAQVAYNNDYSAFLNQELTLMTAIKNLNLQMGQDPSTPVSVSDLLQIPPLELSFEELWKMAQQKNATIIAARESEKASRAAVGNANAAFYPRISLNAAYGYSDRTATNEVFNEFRPRQFNSSSTDHTVGVSLSWNLFNGFRDKVARQNALIDEKVAQLQLQNVLFQQKSLLLDLYDSFFKQLEILKLEQENVVAAQQNLQRQQERYDIGAASSLDFRDAQLSFIRAQSALIVAQFRALITRLEIDRMTGQIQLKQ